jgi:two-component system, cell cycle response regulator DivK
MTMHERTPLILLVDDSADARQMYATYFVAVGCQTDEACDGFVAFDHALKHRPDAIVMDLRMPRLDGWEAVRLLKNRAQTREIPIVALTGDEDVEHLKLARNAGCDAVLLKPCPPEEVHATVLRLLAAAEDIRVARTYASAAARIDSMSSDES